MKRRAHTTFAVLMALGAPLWAACGSDRAEEGEEKGNPGGGEGGASGDAGGAIHEGGPGDGGAGESIRDDRDGEGRTDVTAGEGGVVGDSTGITAVRASDFLDSIGVCAHVAQGVDAPSQSATALAYAGIRNVRDDGNPDVVKDWIAMHQSAGVRMCVLSNSDIGTTIDMAKQLNAAGALLAVEGPNEPNNFPVTYEGQTSTSAMTFVPVAHFQRDLYAAVKAETSLGGIPVFHTSEAGGSEPDNVGLQFLTIPSGAGATMPDGTRYADYANTHNYVCGHSQMLVDNVAWNASDPTLNGDWDGLYVEYGRTWHAGFTGYSNTELLTLPRVTTETGWVTSGSGAITEEQQGRIFLNLYLSAFAKGIAYTFIYMLRDDSTQGDWGLFDTNYQPKKSGTYLHNLTSILAGAGAGMPGKLNYSIANEPQTVHDLLLQKGDGTFALAVWDERPGGGTDDVTVNLVMPRATVRIYDPTTGTSPTQTLAAVSTVALTLGDHPLIIVL